MTRISINNLGHSDKAEHDRLFAAELDRIEGSIPVFSDFRDGVWTTVEFATMSQGTYGMTLKMRSVKISAAAKKQAVKDLVKGELKIYVLFPNKMYVIVDQDGEMVHIEHDVYIESPNNREEEVESYKDQDDTDYVAPETDGEAEEEEVPQTDEEPGDTVRRNQAVGRRTRRTRAGRIRYINEPPTPKPNEADTDSSN